MTQIEDKDMRAEYDFTKGVRGKHYRNMQAGYSITVHKADGTTVVKNGQKGTLCCGYNYVVGFSL